MEHIEEIVVAIIEQCIEKLFSKEKLLNPTKDDLSSHTFFKKHVENNVYQPNTNLNVTETLHETNIIKPSVSLDAEEFSDKLNYKLLPRLNSFGNIKFNDTSGFEEMTIKKQSDCKLSDESEEKYKDSSPKDGQSRVDSLINSFGEELSFEMLTSTPKKKDRTLNLSQFHSLEMDNLNGSKINWENISSETLNKEDEKLIDQIVEKAITKYEEESDFKEFKDVSVQAALSPECKCDRRKKNKPNNYPPTKKLKIDKNFFNFFATYNLMNKDPPIQQVFLEEKNLENGQTVELKGINSFRQVSTTNHEMDSTHFKTINRIRVGLSKRAKSQPLHSKIIY